MKNKILFGIEAIVMAFAVFTSVLYISDVLLPEYYAETYGGFYELEEDTVDVLFLGSSHCFNSFIPQELYDEYGITSYNLGSGNQSLLISYYWLKEALQTQSPEVVIVEAFMLYQREDLVGLPLGSAEGDVRNAMNYMKMGKVKREAIHMICEEDDSYSEISFYFPWIRYHSRWTDLGMEDFVTNDNQASSGMMGYSILYGSDGEEYEPVRAGSSAESEELNSFMVKYLLQIQELCEEEGIELILTIVPTKSSYIERYNATFALAEEYEIPLYDFNEQELYDEIGFDYGSDMVSMHPNIIGALKLTDYIGEVLQKEYDLGKEGRYEQAWEDARETYLEALSAAGL